MGRDFLLSDLHAHPFEVLTDQADYAGSPGAPGLFGRGPMAYAPPAPGGIREVPDGSPSALGPRALLLQARIAYAHTGPRVFRDQMSLCGLRRSLLLPVSPPGEGAAGALARMSRLEAVFPRSPEFPRAVPLPPGIPASGLPAFLAEARERHGAAALKVHPNLSGLDLGAPQGRAALEAALSAAGQAGLPIILHAGRSPGLEPAFRCGLGSLANLSRVDLSDPCPTVILAHGGLLGLGPGEIERDAIPLLKELVGRREGILADTSALGPSALGSLVRALPPEKLLFGSDALYHPPWRGVALLLSSLRDRSTWEEDFLAIACRNPSRWILRDTLDPGAAHPPPQEERDPECKDR